MTWENFLIVLLLVWVGYVLGRLHAALSGGQGSEQ
jgi:hypothetical protein